MNSEEGRIEGKLPYESQLDIQHNQATLAIGMN